MDLKQALITYSNLVTLENDGFLINWQVYWFNTFAVTNNYVDFKRLLK